MNAKKLLLIIALPLSLIISGCGKKSGESSSNKEQSQSENTVSQTEKILSVDPAQAGIIKGKALSKGNVPSPKELPVGGNPECKVFHAGKLYDEEILVKDGRLKNVFIYIKEGLENYRFDSPKEAVKIDQVKCIYVPHVTGAQVDQPILLVNSDSTLHNVHSYSKENPAWNLGMPFEGMELTKKFSKPEIMVTMKCDVHPWMIGYVGVVSHPYFAVTGEDGTFELKNLPPGEYLIEAWHEKLGVQSQKVQIAAQQEKELEFSFELSSK
jgi:plastocyanin